MKWQSVSEFTVECIGEFDDEYVYDIEMADDSHMFFANDILLHNSCYVNIEAMTDSIIGKDGKFTKENIEKICKEIDDVFVKAVNKNCFEHIVKDIFHSSLDTIEFKREAFASEGAFLAKKRYILHTRNDEGAACDKFKYVGVDVKKVELPIAIRNSMKHIIESSMIDNWTMEKYKTEMRLIWEKFEKLTPEQIALFKGYSTPKETLGFLQLQKGAGAHVRAAIYHNQLLEKFGIKGKYEDIKVGDRLQFVYIKPNVYGIDVIGFLDKMPDEFKKTFVIDFQLMFHKMMMKPLKSFCEVNGWSMIDPSEECIQSVMDL